VFPQLKPIGPTGGPRDLSGMSGSGLWIKTDDGIRLTGILLGPTPGETNQHLIRFTPIWKVIEELKK